MTPAQKPKTAQARREMDKDHLEFMKAVQERGELQEELLDRLPAWMQDAARLESNVRYANAPSGAMNYSASSLVGK